MRGNNAFGSLGAKLFLFVCNKGGSRGEKIKNWVRENAGRESSSQIQIYISGAEGSFFYGRFFVLYVVV